MLTCPECQHQEHEGSLFCTDCGAPLLTEVDEGRTAAPFRQAMPAGDGPQLVGSKIGSVTVASGIRFVIPASSREVLRPMRDRIAIGRADPARHSRPELDLTEDGGAESGVSREHAAIITTAQGIAIMDLGSVNGTYVNGSRLPPHLPYALGDGDELRFGDLLVHVFFEE